MHRALDTHNRYANDDITTALIEHARSSILYERQLLKDLESLRVDVSNANKKVLPAAKAPRPSIIPPLEDFGEHPAPPSAPVVNGNRQARHLPPPPQTAGPSGAPFRSQQTNPPSRERSSTAPSPALNGSPHVPQPLSSSHSFAPAQSSPLAAPIARQPLAASASASDVLPSSRPQVDGSPAPEPPLGGKFLDGSKSMFITPTHGPSTSAAGASGNPPIDPLRNDAYKPAISPLHDGVQRSASAQPSPLGSFDPLGQIKTRNMSSSVRIQRPRLDPKEAASKLANMF